MGVLYSPGDDSLDELIAVAQADPADDSAAMTEILRRFEGAARHLARSVTTDWHLQQDAVQGALLGLVKAVRAHTPGTHGFRAYAWRYMKGAASREVASMSPSDIAVSPDEPVWGGETFQDGSADAMSGVVDLIGVLNPVQQTIVVAHYVADLRLSDIAMGLGVSVPAVSQRLSTIHRVLRPVVEEALAA